MKREIRDEFTAGGSILNWGDGWVTILMGKGSVETEMTIYDNGKVEINHTNFTTNFKIEGQMTEALDQFEAKLEELAA